MGIISCLCIIPFMISRSMAFSSAITSNIAGRFVFHSAVENAQKLPDFLLIKRLFMGGSNAKMCKMISGGGGGRKGVGGGSGGTQGFNYKPKGVNQEKYVDILGNPNKKIIFAVGPAGCGKTMLACSAAIQELRSGNVDKIIMTRPLVSVDNEDIGFLPGTITNKMDPWTRPIIDIFNEFYTPSQVISLFTAGKIEIAPLAYMRGRTFKRSFIIADEMQNSSPNQMLMMTTRLGENSKMVITGDLKQSDRNDINGLEDFINKWVKWDTHPDEIDVITLTQNDIQRSPVVEKLIELYSNTSGGGGGGGGGEKKRETPVVIPVVVPDKQEGGCGGDCGDCGGCDLGYISPSVKKPNQPSYIINDAALIPNKDYYV